LNVEGAFFVAYIPKHSLAGDSWLKPTPQNPTHGGIRRRWDASVGLSG